MNTYKNTLGYETIYPYSIIQGYTDKKLFKSIVGEYMTLEDIYKRVQLCLTNPNENYIESVTVNIHPNYK